MIKSCHSAYLYQPIVKYGRFGLPGGYLPGGGRPGLKYGISRKIRQVSISCIHEPMASAEREPITRVWWRIPQQSPWSCSQGALPPTEAEIFLVVGCPNEAANVRKAFSN